MRPESAQILDILGQLVETCRSLHEASERKCAGLASMDLDVIQEAGEQEEALSGQLKKLNAARRRLLQEVTGEEENTSRLTPGDEGPMHMFIATLPTEEKERAAGFLKDLGDEMKKVQLTNITNKIVSKRSLRHFRGMLNLIVNGSACEGPYNRRGLPACDFRGNGLINHIA